jgi:hypothetical protein
MPLELVCSVPYLPDPSNIMSLNKLTKRNYYSRSTFFDLSLTIIYSRKHFHLTIRLQDIHFMLFSIYHDNKRYSMTKVIQVFSASLPFHFPTFIC